MNFEGSEHERERGAKALVTRSDVWGVWGRGFGGQEREGFGHLSSDDEPVFRNGGRGGGKGQGFAGEKGGEVLGVGVRVFATRG